MSPLIYIFIGHLKRNICFCIYAEEIFVKIRYYVQITQNFLIWKFHKQGPLFVKQSSLTK